MALQLIRHVLQQRNLKNSIVSSLFQASLCSWWWR